ncbi:MAG: carbonic anhydrase [Acidobacteria bacterium]|nr:carbonic anhydrase [Acidobacteriota bacterium]
MFAMFIILTGLFAVGLSLVSDKDPNDALKTLYEGNVRFVKGQNIQINLDSKRRKDTTVGGQQPFATVLSCSDSRVPVEHIFNVGIGDIFNIKVAGNILGMDQQASIEYSVDHLGTPILVILGHTNCGAVMAAVTEADVEGALPYLLDKIKPAFCRVKERNPGYSPEEIIPTVIEENIWYTIEDLFRKSDIVKNRVKQGILGVVGGLYNIETGAVAWLGAHPKQEELIK